MAYTRAKIAGYRFFSSSILMKNALSEKNCTSFCYTIYPYVVGLLHPFSLNIVRKLPLRFLHPVTRFSSISSVTWQDEHFGCRRLKNWNLLILRRRLKMLFKFKRPRHDRNHISNTRFEDSKVSFSQYLTTDLSNDESSLRKVICRTAIAMLYRGQKNLLQSNDLSTNPSRFASKYGRILDCSRDKSALCYSLVMASEMSGNPDS